MLHCLCFINRGLVNNKHCGLILRRTLSAYVRIMRIMRSL
ncbi:1067_t:CDS:2 [Rhizophagus irregularis]|nr:1067_t:CDS:2 [Rhizophagus irregularis]